MKNFKKNVHLLNQMVELLKNDIKDEMLKVLFEKAKLVEGRFYYKEPILIVFDGKEVSIIGIRKAFGTVAFLIDDDRKIANVDLETLNILYDEFAYQVESNN